MLIRLSKQTYKRLYGEYTYFFEKVSSSDKVFRNAQVFCEKLTRVPIEKTEILDYICSVYDKTPRAELEADFNTFLGELANAGYVLAGETEADIEKQEKKFTYDVPDPKTMSSTRVLKEGKLGTFTQTLLEQYVAEHPTLFSLQLDITQACTERCRHCYVPEYNPLFLPYDRICSILDEFREMGGLHITLSGGECMMHPDILKIIKAIRMRDCTVACLSNLTRCTDEIIKALKDADGTIQTSLYSMTPKIHDEVTRLKGSWLRTVGAIIRLRAADVPLRISCPTMQINYNGYTAVLKFAESLKMSAQTDYTLIAKADGDCSNLCNRLTLPQTKELLTDIILKTLPIQNEYFNPDKKSRMDSVETWKSRKVCGACTDSMCLEASGDYYPCPGFAGKVLGSCYRDSLHSVWMESPVTKRIRAITGADFPKCATCADRDYCSVCLCRNFNETGDMFNIANHFCKVARINHDVVDEKQREMGAAISRV